MPTPARIAFDVNVIDYLIDPANQPRVQVILRCVEAGAIEAYATQELIGEAARIIEAEDRGEDRTERLRLVGGVIGHLTDGRHLRKPEVIVESEVMGNVAPFASEGERLILLRLLAGMAEGNPDRASLHRLAAQTRKDQAEATANWKRLVEDTRRRIEGATKKERREFLKTPFETVAARQWDARGEGMARRFAEQGLDYARAPWSRLAWRALRRVPFVGDPAASRITRRVMENPDAYPYLRRFVRVFALLLYWWWAKQHKVHQGDQNDARQLTVLPVLDHFVTDDKNLREWSSIIGDPPDKVLSVEDFLNRTWC